MRLPQELNGYWRRKGRIVRQQQQQQRKNKVTQRRDSVAVVTINGTGLLSKWMVLDHGRVV